jgi:thioredoxin 1
MLPATFGRKTNSTMSNFKQLIESEKPVLVDFYATWCGPCKMMSPILEEVKERMGEDVTIVKVDVDKNPAAAQAYKVRGVPTLIIFQHGQVKWRESGVIPASLLVKQLKRFV